MRPPAKGRAAPPPPLVEVFAVAARLYCSPLMDLRNTEDSHSERRERAVKEAIALWIEAADACGFGT